VVTFYDIVLGRHVNGHIAYFYYVEPFGLLVCYVDPFGLLVCCSGDLSENV
jgi:hypothetical protein